LGSFCCWFARKDSIPKPSDLYLASEFALLLALNTPWLAYILTLVPNLENQWIPKLITDKTHFIKFPFSSAFLSLHRSPK
jgi:hypothetical protein